MHVYSDAFVVRVSPPDPDSCQMVLALIHCAAFRTAFPRVSSWVEIRRSSSTRNRWGACAWGVARARHARVSLRNGPFRTIPDSLRSPQGFGMRVARPHRRFSTVEKNRVTSTLRQHMSTGNARKHSACAVAQSLPNTLADFAPPRPRPHHHFSMA
jgi:hypothetical protein